MITLPFIAMICHPTQLSGPGSFAFFRAATTIFDLLPQLFPDFEPFDLLAYRLRGKSIHAETDFIEGDGTMDYAVDSIHSIKLPSESQDSQEVALYKLNKID